MKLWEWGVCLLHGNPLSMMSTSLSDRPRDMAADNPGSEEHTSELQSLMRISYAVFCLKKKNKITTRITNIYNLIYKLIQCSLHYTYYILSSLLILVSSI